ncbi:hypothetical protein ACQP3C_30110, partial [Escherichia coli]
MDLGYHLTLKDSLLFGKLCLPVAEVWEVQLVQRVKWCKKHDLLRNSSESLDSGGFYTCGHSKATPR